MCNLTQYDTKLQRMICILLPNAKARRKYPTLIISPFRINDTSVMLYLLLILVYSKVSKVLNSYLSWFPYLSPSTSFMIMFTSIIFYLLSFNLSFILPKNWILFAFYTYIILIFLFTVVNKIMMIQHTQEQFDWTWAAYLGNMLFHMNKIQNMEWNGA